MTPTLRARLILFGGLAAAIEVILFLNILDPIAATGDEEVIWMWVGGLASFPVAAALLLAYRPSNPVSWVLGVAAASSALIFLMTWYAVRFPDAPFSPEVEALEKIPAALQPAAMFSLLHLFPTGRFVGRWHARTFAFIAAAFVVMLAAWMVSPSPLLVSDRPNPWGIAPEWVAPVGDNGSFIVLPLMVTGVASLILRWRRAGSIERTQLRWFRAAGFACTTILVIAFTAPGGSPNNAETNIAGGFVIFAFWSLPAAIVIAVLRYRLYDIDLLINRTLVYGSLTAATIGSYLLLVLGLGWLARTTSGQGSNEIAVAATTLIVAALFQPARRRIQSLVDRRFYRARYDASRIVEAFQSRLRDQTDIDAVRTELVEATDLALHPSSINVWIRSGQP